MAPAMTIHRFSVAEYEKMAETGILPEDARVELIDGEIVDMAPIGYGHQARVDRLNELLVRGLAGRAIVRTQGSVRVGERSEPEPDLALLRRREDFYAGGAAGPADVLLVIEVADTSLAYDRDVKASLYARAAIPEYWLVDLNGATVLIHREPGPEGYREVRALRGVETLNPEAFPDLSFTPSQILG